MKTRISSTITKLLAAVLVIVVGILAVNSTANYHLHKLPSGQIVAHSHPFKSATEGNSPVQSHNHTRFEFHFFSSILLLFFVGAFLIAKLVVLLKTQVHSFHYGILLENTPESLTNKAPPFVL